MNEWKTIENYFLIAVPKLWHPKNKLEWAEFTDVKISAEVRKG